VLPAGVGAARHQLAQHPGQAHRLLHEVGPDQRRAGRRGVPGGEEQVDDGDHGREPVAELGRGRDAVGDAGDRDLLLRPGDPGRHGRLEDQERPGDVGNVRTPAAG
jgi:putative intracellular protease/amidase